MTIVMFSDYDVDGTVNMTYITSRSRSPGFNITFQWTEITGTSIITLT